MSIYYKTFHIPLSTLTLSFHSTFPCPHSPYRSIPHSLVHTIVPFHVPLSTLTLSFRSAGPECVIPSDPSKHPIFSTTLSWIKLNEVASMSPVFYLIYRGYTYHDKSDCDLDDKHLYKVTKFNSTGFLFDPLDPPKKVKVCREFFGVYEKSNGFISCAQGELILFILFFLFYFILFFVIY